MIFKAKLTQETVITQIQFANSVCIWYFSTYCDNNGK